jgi:acyl-CoA oxidase
MKNDMMAIGKEHELLNMMTMQKERQKAAFDVRQLTYILGGGRDLTELFELVCKQLERDHIFYDDGSDLSIMDQKRITMCRMRRLLEYKEKDDVKTFEMRMHVIGLFDPSTHVRFGVHAILFQNTLLQNATDEQLKRWWDDAFHLRTIGCFAMVNGINHI